MHQCRPQQSSIRRRFTRARMFVFVAVLSVFLPCNIVLSNEAVIAPSEIFSPQQVISIVVDSLKSNGEDDQGIATVFRFASPSNKSVTGPLSRFTQMLKRGFPDMLNHTGVRYDDIDISGDSAVQAVWLQTESGAEYGYAFQLRKQGSGVHEGMWMTEAVIPLGEAKDSGIRI